MIETAKRFNLEFEKNEQRRSKIRTRFHQRRQFLASQKNEEFNKWANSMYVDQVSLYLYLTDLYWARIQKRSIKTMNIEIRRSTFIDADSVLLEETFEKVVKHFAKHQIKVTVKDLGTNGAYGWKFSLKTLELY